MGVILRMKRDLYDTQGGKVALKARATWPVDDEDTGTFNGKKFLFGHARIIRVRAHFSRSSPGRVDGRPMLASSARMAVLSASSSGKKYSGWEVNLPSVRQPLRALHW